MVCVRLEWNRTTRHLSSLVKEWGGLPLSSSVIHVISIDRAERHKFGTPRSDRGANRLL